MRKTFVRCCVSLLLAPVLAVMLGTVALAAAAPNISVQISATESGSLPVGKTRTLTAIVTVNNGTPQTNPSGIEWKSSNESVATVSNGTVTAKGVGETTITATYKHTANGNTTEETASAYVKVTSAAVDTLVLEIDGTQPKTTPVGESCVVDVNITPTWSNSTTSGKFTDGQLKNLTWTARIVSGSEFISLPYTRGNGSGTAPAQAKVRVDGKRATGTNEKAEIEIEVTYKNIGTGVEPASGTIKCEITVGSSKQVVITEYSVAKEEVYLTLGDGNIAQTKTLQAYYAENNEYVTSNGIAWSITEGDSVTIRPLTNGRVELTPVQEGETKLEAKYTDGTKSTVTCIVTKSGGGSGTTDPDNPDTPTTDSKLPTDVTASISITSPTGDPYPMDPGTVDATVEVSFRKGSEPPVSGQIQVSRDGNSAIVVYNPTGGNRCELPIYWETSDKNIAQVGVGNQSFRITARQPGQAVLTVGLKDKDGPIAGATASLTVEVKGFKLTEEAEQEIELIENTTRELSELVEAFGDANISELTCWSDNSTVAGYVNGKVVGYTPGKTRFTVSDTKRGFRANFDVKVIPDPDATIDYGTLYTQTKKSLSFSELLSRFRRQAGGSLSHITGLNVDASKGTLYYRYNESNGTGAGVGSGSYYHPYRSGGVPTGERSIEDITFVPKPGFAGKVTVYYTGVSEGDSNGPGSNYACRLEITVDPGSGSNAGISLSTDYNTALRFSGDDFNRVCRERLGVKLDHVVFSQPPEREGKLYTNYAGAGNYGRVVDTQRKYSLKELDDIWFVPAPGYSGPVTVYYTAYGVGANAGSYAGQVTIQVGREGGVANGGLAYDISKGGVAHFDDEDFNDYCQEILDRWQDLSLIRFDALPSESEGVLYYDYRSSVNTGTRAVAGTSYYYGARNPRIDRLAFVPAADFTGTVKIPFTGWSADGTSFGGNVEINVRSGTGSGDIYYTCAPGRTVNFRSSDFAGLSNTLTGRTIDYIVFRSLPSSEDGTLYYGSSRITSTGSQYRNSNIGRLSFRASNSFSGAVDIPFEGRSANGSSFYGVVTIGTSSSGGGSSGRYSIYYNTDYGSTAVFNRVDFDDLSQWETDRNISSVRFKPPLSSEGTLYRNYRSSSNMGTRITSDTTVNASDLDRVAFVPASGFEGTAYVDFTATASGSGGTFTGTVEVVVGRGYGQGSRYFSDMAGYSSVQQAAVDFLYERNVTRGLTTGQYGPQNSIRRGDFARMIYQAFGFAPSGMTQAFVDVPAGVYYAEAVNALYARGVVSGIGGGYYAPDSTLTRQDAVCMVQRAMRATGRSAEDGSISTLYGYSDGSSVAGYAQGAMAMAVQRGYLPTSGGWLSPYQPLTRVDMAEILYRVLTY